MKNSNFYLSLLFCFFSSLSQAQTRESDYNYILNHFLSDENNSDYIKKDLTSSSIAKDNQITATLKFVSFTTVDDNKKRGMAIIYKEKKNVNEIVRTMVFCFPEKNSDNTVNNKAVLAFNSVKDTFILKYILSGFIKLGVNY